MIGGIVVPLCMSHPDREIEYVLKDSGASVVLASPVYTERLRHIGEPLGTQVQSLEALNPNDVATKPLSAKGTGLEVEARLSSLGPSHGALIIYTSGTTGRPKGALHTHKSLEAQIETLKAAWEWQPSDRIVHALPLHHVHGIVNALYCPLASGAAVEFLPKFSPKGVWDALTRVQNAPTVFMGVPTMYAYLLDYYDARPAEEQKRCADAARGLRLAVSGSAACPLPILERWKLVAGEYPLERYGMTETGMLLGNPLRGERRAGTVGQPFAGIETRLHLETGELEVRGPQLFAGYWNRPEATTASFTSDGFFLTGDTAEVDREGYYRLLGRTSVDLIKSKGYKISALQIESALLEHPLIGECAVVGLPDERYGETIAAIVALKSSDQNPELSLEELQSWALHRLAPYQMPTTLRMVPALPRNAMGKVNKKAMRAELWPELFATNVSHSASAA
jgi:malonyl-CoA/methylmalonyl-CoA synthetase